MYSLTASSIMCIHTYIFSSQNIFSQSAEKRNHLSFRVNRSYVSFPGRMNLRKQSDILGNTTSVSWHVAKRTQVEEMWKQTKLNYIYHFSCT